MKPRIMIFGVGTFAHSVMQILRDNGAEVSCYLTRESGHFGAASVGKTWTQREHPSPIPIIRKWKPDVIIPMSIDWYNEPWADKLNVPIFCPTGEAIKIERDRDFARGLCATYKIPHPQTYLAKNKLDALEILRNDPRPYVLKNPFCSPQSPIRVTVCKSVEDTYEWLNRIDFSEGVLLQEYLGTEELGHFMFIADGKIQSLVSNWEYKYAFTGNMGPLAGAPLGGLAEQDYDDKFNLAKNLVLPLLPWLKKTKFCGPLQVSAIKKCGKWHVIEYNTRLGVTTNMLLLRMLKNPVETIIAVAKGEKFKPCWHPQKKWGCSLTLAGYGYPYPLSVKPTKLPISFTDTLSCDLWWNEANKTNNKLFTDGHRIAEVAAFSDKKSEAVKIAYENIKKIQCLGSYYRLDIGK